LATFSVKANLIGINRSITVLNISIYVFIRINNIIMANNASENAQSIPAATSGSRSKLLSTNFKNFLSKPAVTHPQKALTVQLFNAEQENNKKQEHNGVINAGSAKERDAVRK
jgi:hypothetical protein